MVEVLDEILTDHDATEDTFAFFFLALVGIKQEVGSYLAHIRTAS